MSFPPYPSYRDTGIEWLTELPEHWNVVALKRLVSLRSGEAFTSEAIEENGQYAVYGGNGHRGFTSSYTHEGSFVLVGRQGALCGNVNYASGRFWASEHALVASPLQTIETRWLGELLRSMGLNQYSVAAAQPGLSAEALGNLRVPLPPRDEQIAIAALLDRETAKIDALIEEQRRLIALLKEKRQAVISHAVTKGLDQHAPMKDSGIEWLGQVPAHWSVMALRRLVDPARSITYGIVQPGEPDPQGRFMVRGQDYSRGWVNGAEIFRVSDAVEVPYRRARLETGDVVITIVGAGTGNTAVVPSFLSGANITQTTARVAPLLDLIGGEYLATLIASRLGAVQVALYQKGAAQPGLNLEHLAAFRFPVPPHREQAEIVERITPALRQMQELTEAAEQAMALLGERRAALVSAAVTGKIDVRGSAKVLPFPIERTRARGLVATEIIERSASQATFGRVKFQKLAFLAEGHVGISELAGCYTRAAAGPLDGALIEDMERGAHSIAGIAVDQAGGTGTTVSYRLGQQRGAHRRELAYWLGPDRTAKLDKLLADFAGLNTKQAEAVATLYGVWNDLLSEGASPSDDEIISGFLNDWHPEKLEKFRASELAEWLGWMRRHGMVPTGSGPPTTTGRLFV